LPGYYEESILQGKAGEGRKQERIRAERNRLGEGHLLKRDSIGAFGVFTTLLALIQREPKAETNLAKCLL